MGELTEVGRIVRDARIGQGWSIREFAEKAAVAPMTIQRIERGDGVRIESWRGVARALGVDEDLLVGAAVQKGGPRRLAEALGVRYTAVVTAEQIIARVAQLAADPDPASQDELTRLRRILPELWGDDPKGPE